MSIFGDLSGGFLGESSAEKAAKEGQALSKKVKKEILAELRGALKLSEQDLQPFIDSGMKGVQGLTESIGQAPGAPTLERFDRKLPKTQELQDFNFNADQLGQTDAFKFRFDVGQQATDRAQAANRGLTSGNRLMALQDFGQGLASTEFENEFNRQLAGVNTNNVTAMNRFNQDANRFGLASGQVGQNNQMAMNQFGGQMNQFGQNQNTLGNLTNVGQGASTNLANMRLNTAGNVSNALTQNAANQFSASLIPVQERQNFMNQGFGLAGNFIGRK